MFTICLGGVIFEHFVDQVHEDAMRIAHFQKCVSHESGACVYIRYSRFPFATESNQQDIFLCLSHNYNIYRL